MNNNDKSNTRKVAETSIKAVDQAVGNKLALASNNIVPVVAPVVVKFVWGNKYRIVSLVIGAFLFCCFAIEAFTLQATANVRAIIVKIPEDHKSCIETASNNFGIEPELLLAYSKVISDFNNNHKGSGKGFLEISHDTWNSFGVDANSNGKISEADLCDNYETLANKLKSLSGDSQSKIDQYDYSKKEEVKNWYLTFQGLVLIPYGNPIGLDRTDVISVTSGYGVAREVNGVINVHNGIDIVPNEKWFQENPGKGSTDVVERAIIAGQVTNFKDSAGALCSFITSTQFRTIYCHCSAFIAKDGAIVNYGDPICYMGNTGFSTGAHCHVGIYQIDPNSPSGWSLIDPTAFVLPSN